MNSPTTSTCTSSGIFSQINDIAEARLILDPLFKVNVFTHATIALSGQSDALRSGRYKKRVRVTFQVSNLRQVRIPSPSMVALVNSNFFQIFLLYQYQAILTKFELFIASTNFIASKQLDTAVKAFVQLVAGAPSNLTHLSFTKCSGVAPILKIRQVMLGYTGYEIVHQLINVFNVPAETKSKYVGRKRKADDSISSLSSIVSLEDEELKHNDLGPFTSQLSKYSNGKLFDLDEFGKRCVKVVSNLMFFTQNKEILELQQDSNPKSQMLKLRILDHRPIVQQLWYDTLDFAKKQGAQHIIETIDARQSHLLFANNKQAITDTFNRYILKEKVKGVIQPHPVRALLDHLTYLDAASCFDLSFYDFKQSGLNWFVTSYFVGKNFLTCDTALNNNYGAICLNGQAGSGKSRMLQVMYEFFNGFHYQDSPKGLSEFQNHDMASKSFIKSEEVQLQRLLQPCWKQLADITASVKCKVKQQQDMEATRFVPVIITANDDVHAEIISNVQKSADFAATHRRWAFVRFFESWPQAHPELFDQMGNMLPVYQQVYNSVTVEHELMNSMIGSALLFPNHTFATPGYILPYYTHCLVKLSKTFFGQVLMLNLDKAHQICKSMVQCYSHDTDAICFRKQQQVEGQFEQMLTQYMGELCAKSETFQQLWSNNEASGPLYFRIMSISQHPIATDLLQHQSYNVLKDFLSVMRTKSKLHELIAQQKAEDDLMCIQDFIDINSEHAQDVNSCAQSAHIYDQLLNGCATANPRSRGNSLSYLNMQLADGLDLSELAHNFL